MHAQPVSRRRFVQGSLAVGASVLLPRWRASASPVEHKLEGLKLVVHPPRIVAEMPAGNCWYPDLLKFSTGELMLNHSLNSDSNANQHNSQAVYLSSDGGDTFEHAYDVNGFHNGGGEPRVALPDGTIAGTSTFLRPDPPGQARRFAAHRWTYFDAGRRYQVEPWAAKVEGLPKDVLLDPPGTSRTWWGRINWFSDILPLAKDRWLATLSLRFVGDKRESTVALESPDAGYRWRYLSTVAGPDAVADATEGFDEPCMVQLGGGDVMCVSRVGSGEGQKLARAYTADGGKTWSKVDRLPAYSVAPQILRLQNGVLALSTGRPGISLWLSTDPRGKTWQSFDVMAHHNSRQADALKIRHDREPKQYASEQMQTTAYTAMIEASPNRIFLVYDRTPRGWAPIPKGELGQIFLLEIEVQR